MSTQIKSTASASAPSPSTSDPWALAAGMAAPWRTTQYRIDPVAKMLHLWITRHPQPEAVAKKRSWLGLFGPASTPAAAPAPAQGPEMQWRHLNCMDYTCVIHTTDVLEERHHDLPWLGKPGMPFSNRMAKQVIQTVSNGVELSTVADLYSIAYADLWKFKFAIDNGQADAQRSPPPAPAAASAAPAAPQAHAIPDVAHPVWERLIEGQLSIDIQTLGLQLLLSKLRQQVQLQPTPEVRQVKLRELHRYTLRNAHSLVHELTQIKQLAKELAA